VLSAKIAQNHRDALMKLGKAVSWLMGNLQSSLFPKSSHMAIPVNTRQKTIKYDGFAENIPTAFYL
jgi:hypothetical protein